MEKGREFASLQKEALTRAGFFVASKGFGITFDAVPNRYEKHKKREKPEYKQIFFVLEHFNGDFRLTCTTTGRFECLPVETFRKLTTHRVNYFHFWRTAMKIPFQFAAFLLKRGYTPSRNGFEYRLHENGIFKSLVCRNLQQTSIVWNDAKFSFDDFTENWEVPFVNLRDLLDFRRELYADTVKVVERELEGHSWIEFAQFDKLYAANRLRKVFQDLGKPAPFLATGLRWLEAAANARSLGEFCSFKDENGTVFTFLDGDLVSEYKGDVFYWVGEDYSEDEEFQYSLEHIVNR